MKVKVIEAKEATGVTIATMPPGSLGVTPGNKIYLRTYESATCLNDFGASYSTNASDRKDPKIDAIQLLPKGTIIQIEVE